MRQLLFVIGIAFMSTQVHAQAPELINYQGIARNSSGAALSNQSVGLRLTIRQTTSTGVTVYQETHNPTTNQFGLFNVQIGGGTPVSGTFSSIGWGSDLYFIEVEMDENGGTAYSAMGTNQLISVPYALYAKTSGSSTPGPTGPTGPQGSAGTQGPTGPQGTAGVTGAQGSTGPQGIAGPTGAQGPAGPTGANGSNGATGPTGPQGPTGPAGSASAWDLSGNSGTNPASNFLGTSDAQDLVVRTNNSERIRVTSNGRIGIGTSNPQVPLEVSLNNSEAVILGQAGVGGIRLLRNNSTSGYIQAGAGGATDQLIFSRFGSSNNLMTFDVRADNALFNGNVGIGTTTPSNMLTLRGNNLIQKIHMSWSNSGGESMSLGNGTSHSVILYSNTGGFAIAPAANTATNPVPGFQNQGLCMISNGDIGIKTGSPTADLHVNGTFRLVDGTEGVGKVLTSDASGNASWQTGVTATQEAWNNVTFQNGWGNFGSGFNNAGYYKDDFGVVHLHGLVSGGTVSTGPTGVIFTLPAGYRPVNTEVLSTTSTSGTPLVDAVVYINSAGEVKASQGANAWFTLDGLSFRTY